MKSPSELIQDTVLRTFGMKYFNLTRGAFKGPVCAYFGQDGLPSGQDGEVYDTSILVPRNASKCVH